MSSFSSKDEKDSAISFQRHLVHEVINSPLDAKHVANDLNNANKYLYTATVSVLGSARVRPYDPIYLDGLPNGLSGYWIVLSIRHVFGGTPYKYMQEIEVGTNTLGDTDPNARYAVETRDVQAELANQLISLPYPVLVDTDPKINGTSLVPKKKFPITPRVVAPAIKVPDSAHPDFYAINPPTFAAKKGSITWRAEKGSGLII